MILSRTSALLAAAAFAACSAAAPAAPFDGSSPEEKALIARDPPFVPSRLALADPPKPVGRAERLFNGRDLRGWESWLGSPDGRQTYLATRPPSIGLDKATVTVFTVVTEDGAPAIHVSGNPWGALISKKSYGNYHLHAQFKWGAKSTPGVPRNNGIMYHSHGPLGGFFGTWMSSVEFEIMPHVIGMLLPVGTSAPGKSLEGIDWSVGAKVRVGQDRSTVVYPWRRYMPSGPLVAVEYPAFGVNPATDAERPAGEWNTLDLYVLGDRSIHVVNGVPVMAAEALSTRDAKRRFVPLTRGRIQLQSESAEAYFRDVTIEPIDRLPRITSSQG